MKYLSDYVREAQTQLFKDLGAFFAFSDSQFLEQKKEGVKYVNMGYGLICPKENVRSLREGLDKIGQNGRAKDIKENGINGIISRELWNHECFYTSDWSAAYDAVKAYGITEEQVKTVFYREYNEAVENMG